MSETDAGAEMTVLELSDMSRCVACRRLVTQRRILSLGACKCGARKLIEATYLDEDDILEVEEDYGWDNVKITGVREENVSKGLLQRGHCTESHAGRRTVRVHEERLHSSAAGEFKRERERRHDKLGVLNWWEGTGFGRRFRSPAAWNEFVRSLRKPTFFFGRRHEG